MIKNHEQRLEDAVCSFTTESDTMLRQCEIMSNMFKKGKKKKKKLKLKMKLTFSLIIIR